MKENDELYQLRYPIGEYDYTSKVTNEDIHQWINEITIMPVKLRNTIQPLSEEQLETPYRPGGWKVSQVVHHLCDSHLNGYIRFKLALTENRPTIKPYDEARWAELPEYNQLEVEDSLNFLENLHKRWVILLKSMKENDFERELNHPESGLLTLKKYIGAYAWHGNHHIAHITSLIERERW
jgi:hypothetical protein